MGYKTGLFGYVTLLLLLYCMVLVVLQTSVPVPSPGSGVIEERFVEDGSTVKAGQKLFSIKLGE